MEGRDDKAPRRSIQRRISAVVKFCRFAPWLGFQIAGSCDLIGLEPHKTHSNLHAIVRGPSIARRHVRSPVTVLLTTGTMSD